MKNILLIAFVAIVSLSSCNRNSGEAYTNGDPAEEVNSSGDGGPTTGDSANDTYLYHQGAPDPAAVKQELNPIDSATNGGFNGADTANRTHPYPH
jgi:hypothetical protein